MTKGPEWECCEAVPFGRCFLCLLLECVLFFVLGLAVLELCSPCSACIYLVWISVWVC